MVLFTDEIGECFKCELSLLSVDLDFVCWVFKWEKSTKWLLSVVDPMFSKTACLILYATFIVANKKSLNETQRKVRKTIKDTILWLRSDRLEKFYPLSPPLSHPEAFIWGRISGSGGRAMFLLLSLPLLAIVSALHQRGFPIQKVQDIKNLAFLQPFSSQGC